MQVVEKKVSELMPYGNNPRKNDEAVPLVMASIREFGFKQPIVIDSNGVVVAGHTRLKAAKELGMETVPCIIADDLNEEQIKAYRLADNKVAEAACWDSVLLNLELSSIDMDMSIYGFDMGAIGIEDIDQNYEPEQVIAHELGEANNYIVLEFNTVVDWEKAQEVFGIQRVCTGDENENIRRYGIGRVIDGATVLGMVSDEN